MRDGDDGSKGCGEKLRLEKSQVRNIVRETKRRV